MIADGLFYKIIFNNKDHKDSFLGATKTIEQAIEFTKERMDNRYKDIILIDHRSCTFRSMNQSKGGAKSKRKITPEQQAKLQKARKASMEERFKYKMVETENFEDVFLDGAGVFETEDEIYKSIYYDMLSMSILRSKDNGDFTHFWNKLKEKWEKIN